MGRLQPVEELPTGCAGVGLEPDLELGGDVFQRVTARMALRLGHWFGTEPEFWLNLQAQYDLALAEREGGEAVRRLPTKATPLPPPRRTGRPPKRTQGDQP